MPGALVFLALTGTIAAQQTPTFRAGVDLVRLDVSVLDDDRHPVRGLTVKDFTILVDGVPQPIVAFAPVSVRLAQPPAAPWMRDIGPDVHTNGLGEPRLFVIFIDDGRIPADPYMIQNARAIARAIVDQLGPGDLASVVFSMDNRHAQELTNDRGRLLKAINSFSFGSGSPLMGLYAKRTIENVIEVLGDRTQGRSAIFAIGMSVDVGGLLPGGYVFSRLWGKTSAGAGPARVPIYGFSIAGLPPASILSNATRGPGGISNPNPHPTEQSVRGGYESFRGAADLTGGRAIVNTNAPAMYVPEVFAEASYYYLLGYQPTYPTADGKARHLQIRVNRKGVTIFPSDRRFLSAKTRPPKKNAIPPSPLQRALADLLPSSDVPLRLSIAPFALPDGRDRKGNTTGLVIALGVERPAPIDRMTEHVELLARVFTQEGKSVASARQTAAVVLRPSDRNAEYELRAEVNLKPGNYNLRVSAHSATLDKTGSVYADVVVPDFSKDKVSLSGIVIGAEASAAKGAPTSIVPVVPTTVRDFARSDHVVAFMRIYQGGKRPAVPIAVSVRITNAESADVFARSDELSGAAFTAGRGADYQLELPCARLPAGVYLLTITATLDEKSSARRDVRFAVR